VELTQETISAKRTAVNSTITIWLIGLVTQLTGWEIKLDDLNVLYIGAAIGAIMGIVYRVSRYLSSKYPLVGWFLFGSGKEPSGLKKTGS
jgi:hypothetical protein